MMKYILFFGLAAMLCAGGCFSKPKPEPKAKMPERYAGKPREINREYMIKNNDIRGWQETNDDIMRRTVFRLLINSPEHRLEAARKGITDNDPVIRRSSVYTLFEYDQDKSLPEITKLGKDVDFNVRFMVASCAAGLARKNNAEALLYLDNVAKNDADIRIRQLAARASWPYYRETQLLRKAQQGHKEMVKVDSFDIPETNWKLQLDPGQDGHLENFHRAEFDDSAWSKAQVGYWEDLGFGNYDGIAWYRIRFTMPEKVDSNAVELLFGGVDDSAWVWLNDTYIGQHDLGKDGSIVPFQLDATREIQWGKENLLVVRVSNSIDKGGIFKPIKVDIYK